MRKVFTQRRYADQKGRKAGCAHEQVGIVIK